LTNVLASSRWEKALIRAKWPAFFFDNGELLCGLLKFPDVFPIKENNRVVDDRLFRRTAATRVFRSSSAEKR